MLSGEEGVQDLLQDSVASDEVGAKMGEGGFDTRQRLLRVYFYGSRIHLDFPSQVSGAGGPLIQTNDLIL